MEKKLNLDEDLTEDLDEETYEEQVKEEIQLRKVNANTLNDLATLYQKGKRKPKKYNEKVKNIPLPISMEEVEILSKRLLNDGIYYYLYLFIYLFGCRVTEALNIRRSDIMFKDDVITARINTLKNRKTPLRYVPCYLYGKESKMALKLWDWIKKFDRPDQKLFPVTRQRAFNHFTNKADCFVKEIDPKTRRFVDNEFFQINPHFLRHCRLTHLVSEYHYDLMSLIHFAGWTDSKPATIYVRLDWQKLAEPLKQKL